MKKTINGFNISSRIEQLEKQVSSFSVTNQKYELLREGLDQTFDALTRLKTETFVAKELEERVVTLFGELENKTVERDLSHIQKKTQSLQKGRISNKAIGQLEERVKRLKENHLTLSRDRQIIQAAEETLIRAKRRKEGEMILPPTPLQNREAVKTALDTLDPTEAYDLLEVARMIHDGNLTQARKQFLELPQHLKDRFEELMNQLPSIAFEDPIPTIRALIATVNELVGNGEGYPAISEIDQYFLKPELSTKQENKIIPIDFNLINRHG